MTRCLVCATQAETRLTGFVESGEERVGWWMWGKKSTTHFRFWRNSRRKTFNDEGAVYVVSNGSDTERDSRD